MKSIDFGGAGSRTRAVVQSGLLPEGALRQLQRWGLLDRELDLTPSEFSEEELVECMQAAIEGGDVTEIRETDLSIVSAYLAAREKGRLYLFSGEEETYVDIVFCRTSLGEYAMAWQGESIRDLLLDPRAFLRIPGEDDIHFADVRDLYFGETKALIVCAPAGEVE